MISSRQSFLLNSTMTRAILESAIVVCILSQFTSCLINVRLNRPGVEFANELGARLVDKTIRDWKIGELQQDGSISYHISRTKLKSFSLGRTNVTTENPNVIVVQLHDSAATVTSSFEASEKFNFIFAFTLYEAGEAELSLDDVDIAIHFAVGSSSNGHPKVKITKCTAEVGDSSLTFSNAGFFTGLYNLLSAMFKQTITDMIRDEICLLADASLEDIINQFASNVNLDVPIGSSIADLSLASDPIATEDGIETSFRGCFSPDPAHRCSVQSPVELPANEKMMQASVNEDSLNSLLASLFSSNQLQTLLDPDQVKGLHIDSLFRNLARHRPGQEINLARNLGGHVAASDAPRVEVTRDLLRLFANITWIFFDPATDDVVLTLHASAVVEGSVAVHGKQVQPSVSAFRLEVGGVDEYDAVTAEELRVVNNVIRTFVQLLILPKMKAQISSGGIAIPSVSFLELAEPSLLKREKMLEFGFNLNYLDELV